MRDLIVIGAGPAGLGAALQAARAGRDALVLEKERVGGRLNLARAVGNFPWPAAGQTSGAAIVRGLRRQARRSGVRISPEECRWIDRTGRWFIVRTAAAAYRCRAVVVATGVRPLPPAVPLDPAVARLVHYRWNDIPMRRGGRVAVIGAGEVAFDQACSLAERGAAVTVLCRGARPRAYAGLVSLARSLGVRLMLDRPVSRIETSRIPGVTLVTPRGRTRADAVLVAIGGEPSLPALTAAARRMLGHGLYIAGDAAGGRRQAAIAFGDGVDKAMMAAGTIGKDGGAC
ncbi:MAG: NAD(P)/FAD-dependent oxidoreductase [Candidatus Edwardsbacteria bacterium]|nr:NAD(P)/FAD-dependent oxidoreductase [Candidatus Edwardsbacteria bacterium]